MECSTLASAELVARLLIQVEVATERNARRPDYSGLDIVVSAPVSAAGRATTQRFSAWITDRLKERSQIWKQERLYREERRYVDPNDYGSGRGSRGGGGGGGRGRGKKWKKDGGGGGPSAAADG